MPDVTNPPKSKALDTSINKSGRLPPPFNPDDYRHYLDRLDLTEDQKTELLWMMYHIMRQFVDWGFNLHPIQSAQYEESRSIDVVALLEHQTQEKE